MHGARGYEALLHWVVQMTLRVLLCGSFGGRDLQAVYYNTDAKLRNGLVRAGHHVLAIDERARARDLAPLGLKQLGIRRLRDEVVATAHHYRPHLVLFGHTDLLADDTYTGVRAAAPGARLATFFVDPFTTRPHTLERLKLRAAHMDAVFATTADASVMQPYAAHAERFWFMPYPVDPSIETGRVDATPASDLAWDGLFLGSDIGTRAAQLTALRDALPDGYRLHVGGRQRAQERLTSTTFVETIAKAAVCPQLPLDDTTDPVTPHLYTSARIAQTLGQGVLALTPAAGGFEHLYDDGVVPFGSREELAARMAELHADDTRRRAIAAKGRRLAHERTRADRVARYLVDTALERPQAEAYEWPTAPIC